jgi:glycosidase
MQNKFFYLKIQARISRYLLVMFLLSLIFFSSCKKNTTKTEIKLEESEIFGLASPIKLNYDTTIIYLSDYFQNTKNIKEYKMPPGLTSISQNTTDSLILVSDSLLAPYSLISVVAGKASYDIPVLKSEKIKYKYSLSDPKHRYKSVAMKGEMNAWNPANTPLIFANGKWTTKLVLSPDNYQYQIVVDGNAILDPQNKAKVSNGIGGWNSVLSIKNKNSSKIPQLSTFKTRSDTMILKLDDTTASVICLYQNHKIDQKINAGEVVIKIPAEAFKIKRSYIRVRAFNRNFISDELRIPLDFGKVLTSADQITRQDKESNIIYFIMVDRFKDGNTKNDKPLNDPEVNPKADFKGGDLKGITQMIDSSYFQKLGINCIWLSPIVQNPQGKFGFFNKNGFKSKFSAYHGYWPTSFTKIDDHFGTPDDLKELVNAAHKSNCNVLLDIVAHHVHEQHPTYIANKNKKWTTDLYLPDGTLNTEKWDEYRLTTWFDVFLPTLNLQLPEVSEMLVDSTVFWLKDYNVDGFRHDATKHIPLSFWRTLTKKVKMMSENTGKSYYQVGETYGTPELISSYIGSGMLDAQFDFNVYDAMLNSIIKEELGFDVLASRLSQSMKYYGVNNLMGNMTGNQDKTRFMALASGDVSFEEDGKLAGWSRNISKTNKEGFSKLAMMHSLIMTIPGIPVIYYGDEIGMTGGNDPDNRRVMKFTGLNTEESALFNKVAALTSLRKNNPVFMFGDFKILKAEKDVLVFSRKYFDKTAVVIINSNKIKSNVKFNINNNKGLKSKFGSAYKINNKEVNVEMMPMSYEVLMN